MRIFYIDSNGVLRTHLLAVKLFRPATSLGKVTGKVVLKWFLQVLGQHGIPIERVAGAVTDGGGDVRTGIAQATTRGWCGPHMLNRAIIDGTGMANTASQSKNRACRGLMETCKKVVEAVEEVRVLDFIEEEKEAGVFDFVSDEVDLTAGGEGAGEDGVPGLEVDVAAGGRGVGGGPSPAADVYSAGN